MKEYVIELFFMLLALAIVIALAFLILKGIKSAYAHKNKDSLLKVKLSLPIGNRERIMVLNYKDAEYILGVTPNNISLIDKNISTSETIITENKESSQFTPPDSNLR